MERELTKANPALRALSETRGAPRSTVALLEVQTHFNLHLATINNYIFKELVAGGYYSRPPDQVRLVYLAKGVMIGFLVALVGGLLAFAGNSRLDWIWINIFTAVAILGFGWLMPARSIKGARRLAKVLGFGDFLGRVDKDRLERLQTTPQLFDDVETKWAQAFARITVPPPQWYRGSGSDFFPADLINSVNNVILNKQGA
jgi:hypothetical protein